MRAALKNYRQSPRKVRLVANLIRGMGVPQALTELSFLPKKAALPMKNLLESAVANASQGDEVSPEQLYVKEIQVDKGMTLKRWRPRAFGRAFPIHRHTSHVRIALGTKHAEPVVETANEVNEE